MTNGADAPVSIVNISAEQALLGAIFRNNLAYGRVVEFLKPAHFGNAVHARIYEACGELIAAGRLANPVTLKNQFDQDEALKTIGGAAYLTKLAASAVTIINAEDYARRIHDLYLRRQLVGVALDITAAAQNMSVVDDAAGQIERATTALYDLAGDGLSQSAGPQPIGLGAAESLARSEKAYMGQRRAAGLPTGLLALDAKIGGLQEADMTIIGGRPAMGKSALATTILIKAGVELGLPSLLFSLDMSRERIGRRMLASLTGIPPQRQAAGDLTTPDWQRLTEARTQLDAAPILIDDTPRLSIAALRQRAVLVKRRRGLSLIVVDYLQRARAAERQERRIDGVSLISNGLTELARDLNVPVVALAQLSRALEQRDDKRPMLSDLRESGEIEQDAATVLFLYRHEEYLRREEPRPKPGEDPVKADKRHSEWSEALADAEGRAEIIIAKQRDGVTGVVRVNFDGARSLFTNPYPVQEGLL